MECRAGQAWTTLHLRAGHHPKHQQVSHHRRQAGPSRVRQRARREAARHAAADAVECVAPPDEESTDEVTEQVEKILEEGFVVENTKKPFEEPPVHENREAVIENVTLIKASKNLTTAEGSSQPLLHLCLSPCQICCARIRSI